MTTYKIVFTDGSSYILVADGYYRKGPLIEFYRGIRGKFWCEVIAKFKAREVRGIVKGEILEES